MNSTELLALHKRSLELKEQDAIYLHNANVIADEAGRVAFVAQNARQIYADLEDDFAKATKLKGIDLTFLFFATALQCVRQYVLTDFKERVSDKDAANNTKNKTKESSDRSHRLYKPPLDEIITNPVPFDAIYGSRDFDIGLSGNNHRAKTLGHDPILGWVFGTANIATSTITLSNFRSYHVQTGLTASNHARDKISKNAQTSLVFKYTSDRLLHQGKKGKTEIGISILKEGIHLASDIKSHKSLPLPIINSISPDIAETLADFGIDTLSVLTVLQQAGYSMLINFLIGFIHGLFYEPEMGSMSLYQVRTRKILLYSNTIASSSNVIYCALSQNWNKLDVGGLLVTLYRLASDANFIAEIKKEFIWQGFKDKIMGNDLDLIGEV